MRKMSGIVKGLSHITLIVVDLDRMEELLTKVFGARRIYDSGDDTFSISRERFFLIGHEPEDVNAQVPIWVAIMEGESLPNRTYNHIAFKIEESDYDHCLQCVRSLDLNIREGRPRIDGEGRSIYFHDYDNHLFELHTGTLSRRLALYEKVSSQRKSTHR
jgi:fosfomycin resistance protein FosX